MRPNNSDIVSEWTWLPMLPSKKEMVGIIDSAGSGLSDEIEVLDTDGNRYKRTLGDTGSNWIFVDAIHCHVIF